MITDYRVRQELDTLDADIVRLHEDGFPGEWETQKEIAEVYFHKMKIMDDYFHQINNGEAS